MSLLLCYGNVAESYGNTPVFDNMFSTTDHVSNITDPDHSTNFSSGSGEFDFGIMYLQGAGNKALCISGLTGNPKIDVYSGTTLIYTRHRKTDGYLSSRDNVGALVIPLPADDSRVKVSFDRSFTLSYMAVCTINHIVAGEQSGYSRNHINKHKQLKTTKNLQSAPVSSIMTNKSLSGTLSMPNLTVAETKEVDDTIFDGSYLPFFICEVEGDPEASYCCFDPVLKVTAHPQHIALNTVRLSFTVFNGR